MRAERASRQARRTGFTLLELIAALTLAGLAITMGTTALALLTERSAAADGATVAVGEVVTLRALLSRLVAGAALTVSDDDVVFRGIDGMHDGLPNDELLFMSMARTEIGAPGSRFRLAVARDSEKAGGVLTLEVTDSRSAARRFALLSQVGGLDIRYLTSFHGQAAWSPSWVSTTLLPRGVLIQLSGVSPDSLDGLLRLPIAIAIKGAS